MILKEHRTFSRQLLTFARLDFKKANHGSALGWLWTLIQPLMLLFVYWFVLHVGLRVEATPDHISPLSWLMVGLIAWFFMSDLLNRGTSSIRAYKYLVTKMRFPVSVIPTFVGSARLMVHLFLLSLALLVIGFFAEGFHITWLQLPFYMFLMFLFFTAWSLFAAPLAVLSKDFENAVKAIVRILFWVSGIIWNINFITIPWIKEAMMYNPISFFVEGYRNAVLYQVWFWEQPRQLIIFSGMLVLLAGLAAITYRRSRKELGDLL